MSTSWTVQIRNIWTYGSANGGSSSVQVSRKNIKMEKIFWYLGSIFSLDLVNVNLKNPANPKPMNGWDCKWWWQLCTGGDDPQLQWRDSQEVDATCSSQPPARGPSLLQEKTRSWTTKKSQEQFATCSFQPPGSYLLKEKAKLFSLLTLLLQVPRSHCSMYFSHSKEDKTCIRGFLCREKSEAHVLQYWAHFLL